MQCTITRMTIWFQVQFGNQQLLARGSVLMFSFTCSTVKPQPQTCVGHSIQQLPLHTPAAPSLQFKGGHTTAITWKYLSLTIISYLSTWPGTKHLKSITHFDTVFCRWTLIYLLVTNASAIRIPCHIPWHRHKRYRQRDNLRRCSAQDNFSTYKTKWK